MTLNRFEQICKDYGLEVIINQYSKDINGEYTYACAFFKNEVVAVYDKRRVYCYNRPFTFRYSHKTMMIYNCKSTELYSTSELEENIIKTIGKLKIIFIRMKKYEIEKDFKYNDL